MFMIRIGIGTLVDIGWSLVEAEDITERAAAYGRNALNI
jgi:hypothetical protein